jgi:hypothetical protein
VSAVGELNRIGNNLNQAVHLLHTGVLSGEFAETLHALEAAIRSLKRELLALPAREPAS